MQTRQGVVGCVQGRVTVGVLTTVGRLLNVVVTALFTLAAASGGWWAGVCC